jgi:hypothetical protein
MKNEKRSIQKEKSKKFIGARLHKYCICIPKNVKEAMQIDQENKNTLCMNAVKLEMQNVRVAYEEFKSNPSTLIGCTQITSHLDVDAVLMDTRPALPL